MSRPDGPWEAVLFDFDGTLADTVPLIVESYRHTLGDLETGLTEPRIRSWIGRTLLEVLEERYPGQGPDLVVRYREHNLAHHDALIRTVEGAAGLLAELAAHGIPVAVVSSKGRQTVRRGMRVTGLPEVEHLVGMEDTPVHKPDPAPLLEAARRLGASPSVCVYVGDAVVDVLAARAAGMAAVAVTWGAGTREALEAADHVVDDAAELRQVLLAGARAPAAPTDDARTGGRLPGAPSRTT